MFRERIATFVCSPKRTLVLLWLLGGEKTISRNFHERTKTKSFVAPLLWAGKGLLIPNFPVEDFTDYCPFTVQEGQHSYKIENPPNFQVKKIGGRQKQNWSWDSGTMVYMYIAHQADVEVPAGFGWVRCKVITLYNIVKTPLKNIRKQLFQRK